ncbi:MAG: thiamine phosphate synthase, partial [Pseudomonadota bacterium]
MNRDTAFGLYLVLTDPVAGYEACAEAAVAEGVRFVQLRMKKRPEAEFLAIAKRLREITRGTGSLFIVNDFVEVARLSDADGVHLGQEDMGPRSARSLWPSPGK